MAGGRADTAMAARLHYKKYTLPKNIFIHKNVFINNGLSLSAVR